MACSEKVNAIYDRLTPAERLAQLQSMYLADLYDQNNQLDTAKCRALLSNGIGHFAQYASASQCDAATIRRQVREVQQWLMQNTNARIPALFHEEVLTGVAARGATVYPQQIGQACSFNTELAKEKTRQTSAVMRSIGGCLALSPMVDVVRNPYFNRLEESYGEDAYLSACLGTAFVEGLQGDDLRQGVAACSKHFLGYGGGGDAPEQELMEEILLPHEMMIRCAGSKVVMTGYHKFHGVQCVASRELMQGILRDYLGFDGVMVSDYFAIGQNQAEPDDMHQAAASINAGNDIDFPIIATYATLPQAIEQGLVSEATFERAVKRVLSLKEALGLLDDDPIVCDDAELQMDTPQARHTAYQIAAQSVVMLHNDGILPLRGERKIALVGPNADTMWAMLGDYTYHAMEFFWKEIVPSADDVHIVTLREGLESKLPDGMSLSYACGVDWTEGVETQIATSGDERVKYVSQERRIERDDDIDWHKAISMAAGSDVIIAAMGENDLLSGENRDRGSLRLPGRQEEFVKALIATGKPVVLVMFGGRAQVIGDLASRCSAVLQAWYPGEEGGNAVADILFGNISPSGKLSVSYPRVELNEPICYNTALAQDERVQWPFGYGQSYASFEYSDLQMPASSQVDDEWIALSFTLKNTGSMAADEVVQLYLSPVSDNLPLKPIKLIGFARVSLAAGEAKRVEFKLSPQQLGYYRNGRWNISPGRYQIKVGASSQDMRLSHTIDLAGSAISMPLRDKYMSLSNY